MSSSIWKVSVDKVGRLLPFSSEYDMEAFLTNNPAIIGCVIEDMPVLLKQQIHTAKTKSDAGRLDLVGVGKNSDDDFELRLFELKNGIINLDAVKQIKDYLDSWEYNKSAKDKIEQWITNSLAKQNISADIINNITSNPVGVLIGTKFDTEAIIECERSKLRGIRLSRFFSEEGKSYYIVIEDVIGAVVSTGRKVFGWKTLKDLGVISESDTFYTITDGGIRINAKPVFIKSKPASKNLLFEKDSAKMISRKKNEIMKNIKTDYDKGRVKEIQNLYNPNGINFTAATALVRFAFNSNKHKVYWCPSELWIHDKTKQSIISLINNATGL